MYLTGAAGLFHPPEGPPSGVGVVLLPPFGWDDQSAYRPRRDWAIDLAGAGHAALRLDLPGTGDAAGGARDPDRLGAWTAATAAAAQWLRGAGAGRIVLLGMGVGGLVALASGAGDDLVLWGVPARGRAQVRELASFGRLEASQTGEDLDAAPAGEVRAGGHVLSAETAAALSALEAAQLLSAHAPRRALVLGRDGIGPDAKLLAALEAAGVQVQSDPGHGWGSVTAGPWAARAPLALFALTRGWLAAVADPGAARLDPGGDASLLLQVDGVEVRETPITFTDRAGLRLFGVLAEPVAEAVAGTAVLLNAGAIRHIGPNRMYAEAARRFAAQGVASFRLDGEAIGESDGDDRPYVDVDAFYAPALPDQVRAALDMLEARGLPPHFLAAGMCAGAYWAFQVALEDPRVQKLVMLNARAFFYNEDAEPTRELWRAVRVFTPQGFRYMLQGDRRLLRLGRLLRWLALTPVRVFKRRNTPTVPERNRLLDALEVMRDRGQSVELAFSVEEPLLDTLEREGTRAQMEALGVAFYDLPHISHTLKPMAAQAAAHAVLDAACERAFGEPAAAAAQ